MTIPEMIGQSGMMTLIGMSVVFGFLVIMVAFMKFVEMTVPARVPDDSDGTFSIHAAHSVPAGLNRTAAAMNAGSRTEK